MASKARKFKVTLEQIRIYKKQPKFRTDPCADKMMTLMNSLEASDGHVSAKVYKHVKDVEKCYEMARNEKTKNNSAGTLYYLSNYLDVNKFKKK